MMKSKLITLLIVSTIVFGAKIQAQVIQDFESGLPAGVTAQSDAVENGLTDHPECYSIEANPASSTVNSSANSLKITHKGYTKWASKNNFGIDIPLTTSIPVDKSSVNHYLNFKYYSNTVGDKVAIILYDAIKNVNFVFSAPPATTTSQWVDVSIDINVAGCNVTTLTSVYIMPDFGYATNNRTSDVIVYIDDLKIAPAISFSGDFETGLPTGISAPSDGWENGSSEHPECYSIEPNPASSAVNSSANCFKLTHKGYTHWGSKDNFGIEVPVVPAIIINKQSATHYLKFKYYATTLGDKVSMLLFDGVNNTNYRFDAPDVTLTNTWVNILFDLNTSGCNVANITSIYFLPDFGYGTNKRNSDVIVYIDDIALTDYTYFATSVNTANKNVFGIYPNPTTDIVNILNAKDSKLSMYNGLGKCVLQKQITDNIQSLNVGTMNKGVYILKVTAKDGSISSQKINIK